MDREKRLLLRLERQEHLFDEASHLLNVARRGFLRELGWEPLSKTEEYWTNPKDGTCLALPQAVERARQDAQAALQATG
jgi:hypothetical protein